LLDGLPTLVQRFVGKQQMITTMCSNRKPLTGYLGHFRNPSIHLLLLNKPYRNVICDTQARKQDRREHSGQFMFALK